MLISRRKTVKKNYFIRISSFIIIALIIGFFLLVSFKEQIYKNIYSDIVFRTYVKSFGIGGIDREVTPGSVLKDLGKNALNLNSEKQQIENLIVDIKFKDFQKLNMNREHALEDGMIDKTHYESVNAKIRKGDNKYKAKVRLKGYFLDHLATDKWSLKIKVKNTHLDGMRDFTINAPYTRDFHSSKLINDAMRFKGILAQKDGFYDVTLNGKNIGIMYFEERYSEQFTERAKKPYGPILNFDEKSKMYSFVDENGFWADDQILRMAASNIESLIEDPEKNISLLNQEIWAEYLAITFLFKCFHGNTAINLSYYFHPIDKKFQPISSDNSCGQKEEGRKLGFLPYNYDFVFRLISIDSFREKLIEKLKWWNDSREGEEFIQKLRHSEKILRRSLANESPFLQEFIIDTSHIPDVLKWINDIKNPAITAKENSELNISKSTETLQLTQLDILKGSKIPKITIIKGKQGFIFNSNEYSKERYELDSLIIKYPEKNESIKLDNNLNVKQITKEINDLFKKNNLPVSGISYRFNDSYRNKIYDIGVNLFYIQDNFNPFEDSNLDDILKYFSLDKSSNSFFVEANKTIIINETLNIPENYSLTLNEGSILEFKGDVGLVIKGGLNVNGSNIKQVTLQGNSDKNWSGVLVLGNGKDVVINNIKVIGGNGIINGISHRGAFTVHNSEVNINNSIFKENLSEDALNLVQVKALLNNITISDTNSDGLDVDYGEVKIVDSNFINIGRKSGADAVDVSKTKLIIQSVYFNNVTDKGVSVGENSTATIADSFIDKAFVGIVAKDSSKIDISNVRLDSIIFADTMSYRKKSHFSGAQIRASNLESFLDNHLVQTNSASIINGKTIKAEDLDIDLLYDTLMESIK